MASRCHRAMNLQTHSGRSTHRRQTPSLPKVSTEHVNSPRSPDKVSTTLGNIAKISTASTTTYWAFYPTNLGKGLIPRNQQRHHKPSRRHGRQRDVQHRIRLRSENPTRFDRLPRTNIHLHRRLKPLRQLQRRRQESRLLAHLNASAPLYARLDGISGVSPTDSGFHMSWDHYFDNLSARLCHQKPLPCNITHPTLCVTEADAEEVFRLGDYEYSYIYRDAPQSLQASTGSYGVWIAELAQNIRNRLSGADPVMYRHNVAHNGSISRLLSILQIDVMVWPGMGSEVVFEVYSRAGKNYVRILWEGKVFWSSNPTIGYADMFSLDTLLAYFDSLVGVGASKIPGLCSAS